MQLKKKTRVKDSLVADFCDPAMHDGQSIRIRECSGCLGEGTSNGVQITRVADGWTWWCYRCEHGGKVWDLGMSPVDSLKRLAHMRTQIDRKFTNDIELPFDYTPEIPQMAKDWLYSYELEQSDITHHDLGWSEDFERLVVPVYATGIYGKARATGELIAWIGRTFGKVEKKTNPKWFLRRQWKTKYIYFSLAVANQKVLVLVEDVISAIKLYNTGYNVAALLTTYVPNELYLGLKPYDVKVWLDSDAVMKSLNVVTKFNSVGVRASHVAYPKGDPKDCPYDDIHDVIQGT